MKRHFVLINLILLTIIIFPKTAYTQEKTKNYKNLKNTIRYNITNPLFFGTKSMVFGYERTLGKHHSISVNFGRSSIPKLLTVGPISDSIRVNPNSKEKGFNCSIDYRFYLRNENKYNSPRGVYIGPYYSYYFFERENTLEINSNNFNSTVITDFSIITHSLGAELGYQFVFWNRLTLDLILIGPGLTNYNLKASLNSELSPDLQSDLFQKINDALSEKIPGYTLVLKGKEFEKSGTERITSFGFRYMINVGFRF
jgi:hypothetical protein